MNDHLRIGALCAGFGGLDLAVQDVLGGHLAWVAENDPAASRVLAHRFPSVPNLGDITRIDWATVPPVDIVTAGFPCTDVSVAGRGAGLGPGTRSGLWLHIAAGLAALRPSLVVIENVPGLRSATADRGDAPDPDLGPLLRDLLETSDADTTPDPGRGGVGPDDEDLEDSDSARPVLLRALGAVLGDLAERRFDAEWTSLRAGDVGACHSRARVGVLAWPAGSLPHAYRPGLEGPSPSRRQDASGREDQDAGRSVAAGCGRSAPAGTFSTSRRPGDLDGGPHGAVLLDWGPYAAAVRRWELTIGRPAPAPTEPCRGGARRLSARFVEWVMGVPPGWVTEVPRLSHTDMLRVLGNGVVRQQFSAMIRVLLARALGGIDDA